MLIKAKKKNNPLTQTPAPQPFETMRAEPVTAANQPPIINQAPVIEIDEEEIARLVEIEKQILIKEFETELGQKRLAAEAEIQNRLEEIEINLNNIKKREEEIENFLNQEKINLEAEKAQELEKIKNIEAELQAQFEAATKQGFEQGYNEGKNRLDAVSAEFEQIISNLHRAKESILLEIEPQISSLALEVARKILQRESRLDNKVILEQVQSAIKKITIRGGLVEISINPQDAVHMADLEKLLEKMLDKEVRLLFKEDENIPETIDKEALISIVNATPYNQRVVQIGDTQAVVLTTNSEIPFFLMPSTINPRQQRTVTDYGRNRSDWRRINNGNSLNASMWESYFTYLRNINQTFSNSDLLTLLGIQ